MGKNLVLCADGTCNAFGASHASNAARLIEFLDLDDACKQVVVYDQGLGTLETQHENICRFKGQLERSRGRSIPLELLKPPTHSSRRPRDWPFLLAAMAAGYGLETNVGELYTALVKYYEPGDKVFLFGFSRGAFTVRALAGFVWRFGIPPDRNSDGAETVFKGFWPVFKKEFPDEGRLGAVVASALRAHTGQIDCGFHFMGLWDTVKSYGGWLPIMLPHLRHNPSVKHVRHALAIDEQRGWFETTTWGWLDSDHPAQREDGHRYPVDRIDNRDRELIERQDIREVWFTGCHADVGGGNGNQHTSDIALRWMLGEANVHELRLNSAAEAFMVVPRGGERPVKQESRTPIWAVIEGVGRMSINNGGEWPVRYCARGASPRPLNNWRRQEIWVHESATDRSHFRTEHLLKTAETTRTVRKWHSVNR